MKNCKNCGAPLVNSKCAYCNTEYGRKPDEIVLHSEIQFLQAKVEALIYLKKLEECYAIAIRAIKRSKY